MEWRGRANSGGVASKASPKMTRIQPRREVKATGGNYRCSGGDDPGRFLCRDFDDNSLLSLRRLLLRSFRSREVVLLDLTLDLVILVVGLRGAPLVVPNVSSDPFWLAPGLFSLYSISVLTNAANPVTGTVAIPLSSSFVGTHLVWHAVTSGASGALQNSNPGISIVR